MTRTPSEPPYVRAIITGQDGLPAGDSAGSGGATPGQTATLTTVNDTNVATDILAANANRQGAIIKNFSDQVLYLGYGTGNPSSSSNIAELGPGAIWEVTGGYKGVIRGIWAANSTGAAKVTEWV